MTTTIRRYAGAALIALLVPVMLLPVGILAVFAGLGLLVSAFVALASWVRADSLHTRRPSYDELRTPRALTRVG